MHEHSRVRSAMPYRSSSGVIFGVCQGLATHFDMSVFWLRILFVAGFFLSGIWPVGIMYILLALLMKPEPILPFETEDDAEFYNTYTTSRTMALHRLKRTFDTLDRRIQRIEDIVTARDYDWDRRLNENR